MELCTDASSEKMEACDSDALEAMEGSYGPLPCALKDRERPSKVCSSSCILELRSYGNNNSGR